MTIIKRADLGRPLTWDELDDNFRQVDNLTAAASAAVSSASASATAAAGSATNSFNSANSASSFAVDASASATVAINALMNSTFEPSDFDFTSGGTLGTTDRNKAVYNPADNNWYSWSGTLPHVVAAGTNPLSDALWIPRTDKLLRQDLGSGDGAKLIGGLNYVTPEMSGFVTGVGDADADTAAFQWALNQNAAQVVLDSTKTYTINPGAIQYTGKINVDAGTAKIVCDGAAITITNGAGSKWDGGYLISKTTPFTVIYDEDFNVTEYGSVSGRMPYQESTLPSGVDSSVYYQQISCHILFTTAGELQNGISVTNLKSEYGSVVIAGYSHIFIDGCDMIGGALAASISILNDCKLTLTDGFGWNSGATHVGDITFPRGNTVLIRNCVTTNGRQMGIRVIGVDGLIVDNCVANNNAESGFQFGQYSAAVPSVNLVCTNVKLTNCIADGNFYDGFDLAAVTNGQNGPYLYRDITMLGCSGNKNRQVGLFYQGNFGRLSNLSFLDNGYHGVAIRDSNNLLIDTITARGNGRIRGGYQFVCAGNNIHVSTLDLEISAEHAGSSYINLTKGNQTAVTSTITLDGLAPFGWNTSKWFIDYGVILSGVAYTGGTPYFQLGARNGIDYPKPLGAISVTADISDEGHCVSALKIAGTGAKFRTGPHSMSPAGNSPAILSYNWGVNSAHITGYSDNAGVGSTTLTFNSTSFSFKIYAAGSPTVSVGGAGIGVTGFSPNIDNQSALGATSLRWTQLYAVNSTISTSDANQKTIPVDLSEAEISAFYEIAQLPWVWRWLKKYETEGDKARLHSGPTVQAAIAVMEKYGLDWSSYSTFCYTVREESFDEEGNFIPAGGTYSFRKEELILWMLRATVEKQKSIESRLSALEGII